MAENKTQRFPFSNRGMVQKLDVNQLAEDQYASLINMVSEQEGSLGTRYGYLDTALSWGASNPSLIHSLNVMSIPSNPNPIKYVGEGTQILRLTGSPAASTVIEPLFNTTASKINITQYKSDKVGENTMVYFSTPNKMLRDDGSYLQARVWGINPPFVPAVFAPGDQTSVTVQMSGTTGGIALTTARISDTVASSYDFCVDGTGAGFYYIRPTGGSATIKEMLPGMGVLIDSVLYRVENVLGDTGEFSVYMGVAPSPGDTIVANRSADVSATGTITTSSSGAVGPIDLSLSGSEESGYNSSDHIHFSFYVATPSTVADVRLRLYTDGSSVNYYEKSILPSPAQDVQNSTTVVSNTNNAADSASVYSRGQDQNVYNQYSASGLDYGYDFNNGNLNQIPYDNLSAGLAPAILSPATSNTWTEIDIHKSDFLAVGSAGTGRNSWKYITAYEVIVKPTNSTAAYTVRYGGIYGNGGRGPNSSSNTTLQPYDYIYTYADPTTGAESNPCQINIPSRWIRVSKQGIKIRAYGTDNTNEYAGVTQVRFYRRGGAFSDGLYRFVGFATNPGDGSYVYFNDTLDDLAIVNRDIAVFDNNAPVLSDLPAEYAGSVTGITVAIGELTPIIATIALNGVGDSRDIFTVGAPIYIGGGTASAENGEDCLVGGFGAAVNEITVVTQFTQPIGAQVTVNVSANHGADLAVSAFDRMWLAGNSQNPHVLYSSKSGRPESWPIINELTGNAHTLPVASPDNPINGIAEYNGEIVCLCRNGIYTVRLNDGRMMGPYKTPANRGLYAKNAWGYVDNEIWFLAYDGIYSWSGGNVTKRSYAIDFVFNGRSINGISPWNKSGSLTVDPNTLISIAQVGNEVFMNFLNADGYFTNLRYHTVFDRWSLDEIYDQNSNVLVERNGYFLPVSSVTAFFIDRTSGELYAARSTTQSLATVAAIAIYNSVDALQDGAGASQGPIYYSAKGKFFDMGQKMAKKNFTDIGVEITVGDNVNDFKAQLYYDYSTTPNASDLFDLNPTVDGRQIYAFPLQQSGSPVASFGYEARSIQLEVFGLGGYTDIWHGMDLTYIPMPDQTRGRLTDWDDIGHPWDKRLYNMTIEFDNNNSPVDLYLDAIFGLNSGSSTNGIQTFTLPAVTRRSKISFPVTADIVVKMVRLRPRVPTATYRIWDVSFQKDDYPRDIVNNTDWSDYGYEYEKRFYQLYINCDTAGQNVPVNIEGDGAVLQTVTVNGTGDNRMQPIPINKDIIAKLVRLKVGTIPVNGKFQLFNHKFDFEQLPKPTVLSTPFSDFGYNYHKYAEQITFDVNTNGFDIPVGIWGDGVLLQTVTVNSTQETRSVNITLNPGLEFQMMRLTVNPSLIPSGGRFQLWEYRPIFRPADKGEVYHTFDWDDLGHPYDKKLKECTIEFETQGLTVNIAVDTLTGIDGNTQNLNAQTLSLVSTTRGFKTFPINDLVCKMVRIRSLGTNSNGTHVPEFKMWGYKFGETVKYPADKIVSTEWTDMGYECDKIFRGVGIEIDTGNVDCLVTLEVDGVAVQSWTVNTNSNDRRVFLSAMNNTEINGKLYRLLFSSGTGGKSQLFGEPNWQVIKDSCDWVFWSSYEQAFGSVGFTIIKQTWVDYKSTGSIIVKFYNEDGTLFYSKALPPHTSRDVERFNLPSVSGGVNNKSRKHTITIETANINETMKLYRDSSRLMILNLSADQRQGYYQVITYSSMPIPV